MCGLTGVWQRGGTAHHLDDCVRAMAARISHRGPDDEGLWVDQGAGIALAHRRLAVLDTSPAGRQPMESARGRWVIAYNGEIYNHADLRRELEGNSAMPQWRGHSDTETLVAAIEAWGVAETLGRCRGMFAIAAWDKHERELWLARDRFGEKPLYYGTQGGVFLFGSELGALRAHPAFVSEIDRGALALYTRYNYVPDPFSIYRGVSKLEPGSFLRVKGGVPIDQPVRYWSLEDVATRGRATPFVGSDAEAVDVLEARLGDAVERQMLADVPIGALLSGGIDSSLVTALMQVRSARPIRTFTVGFEEKAYDEAHHARAVAEHLGTVHEELRLTARDALTLIPRLPGIYSEPFADSSQLPTCLVMSFVRRHVTVVLSGDAGDEWFGGYNRYVHGPRLWRSIGWIPRRVRGALGSALTALPTRWLDRLLAWPASKAGVALVGDKLHKAGVRLGEIDGVDGLYASMVSEWREARGMVLGAGAERCVVRERQRALELEGPLARMMLLDGETYLPGDILVKVDRAAMAVSLETRAPFLDHSLVEFAWTLPDRMKIRDGRGKWLLRELLGRHIPRHLIDRPKVGFGIPLDDWLRGPLRAWGEELLARRRLTDEGFFDPNPIRAAWGEHQRGERSWGYRLWSVLMFQAWLERQRKNSIEG